MKRTQIRRVSKTRRKDSKSYTEQRKAYLAKHPICEVCLSEGHTEPRKATEIHHTEQRRGDAYLDEDTWLAVCNPNGCHSLIHFGANIPLPFTVSYYNEFALWMQENYPFKNQELTYGPTWARYRNHLK